MFRVEASFWELRGLGLEGTEDVCHFKASTKDLKESGSLGFRVWPSFYTRHTPHTPDLIALEP